MTAYETSTDFFRPRPEHNPRVRHERFQRVHYYVSRMGVAVSDELKDIVVALRTSAEQFTSEEIRAAVTKQYREAEVLAATKELLCIWIHLEAVDQGGELMPAWLMHFFKLSLYVSDYLIASPEAMEVMDSHSDCREMGALCDDVGLTVAAYLGYGRSAPLLAPVIAPILRESREIRQPILKDALTLPVEEME